MSAVLEAWSTQPYIVKAWRALEKRRLVLRFLRTEIFTTAEVVEQLLGLSTTPTKGTLRALQRDGQVKHHQLARDDSGRPAVDLWGITLHGQFEATENEVFSEKTFVPSSVSRTLIDHKIAIQKVRIDREKVGYTEWVNGQDLGRLKLGEARPDAVALDQNGVRVAFEIELTIKPLARYATSVYHRIQAIQLGQYRRVEWVCRSADAAQRLHSKLGGLERASYLGKDGKRRFIELTPESMRPILWFSNMAALNQAREP